jgi:hypothetical protein
LPSAAKQACINSSSSQATVLPATQRDHHADPECSTTRVV